MKRILFPVILSGAASPAFAHLPPGEYGSFMAGVSHPLFGLDHVLAMITVGLWASLLGGRALCMVPAAFISAMVIGFTLALLGVGIPAVEPMILASSIILGLIVASAVKLDLWIGVCIVGFLALFHGHAHGVELGGAGALTFGVGFMVATALLHAVGIGVGLLIGQASQKIGGKIAYMPRGFGGLTALLGFVLVMS